MQKLLSVQILCAAVLAVEGHESSLRGSGGPVLVKKGFDYSCKVAGIRRTLCRTVLAIDESLTDEARIFLEGYAGIGIQGDVTTYFGPSTESGAPWGWTSFIAQSQKLGSELPKLINGCVLEEVEIWQDEPLARCSVLDVHTKGDLNADTGGLMAYILQEIYTIGSVWDQVKFVHKINYDNSDTSNSRVSYECLPPHKVGEALSVAVGTQFVTANVVSAFATLEQTFQCDLCDYYPSVAWCSRNVALPLKAYPIPMVKRMFKTDCKIGYETINLCTSVFYTGKHEAFAPRLNGQYGVSYGFSPVLKGITDKIEFDNTFIDHKTTKQGLLELCTTTEQLNVPADAPLAQCGIRDFNDYWPADEPKLTIFQEIGNRFGLIGETWKYDLTLEWSNNGLNILCGPAVGPRYPLASYREVEFGKSRRTLGDCDASVYFK